MNLKDHSLLREQCYIDGEWVDAPNRLKMEVDSPATGGVVGAVPSMDATDTRRAIESAAAAFSPWRRKTAKERALILRRWFDLIMENQEDLAVIMTSEQGKALTESRGEIAYAASFIEWFGEQAKRVYGETIPPHQADKRIIVLREPVGVCAAITPWNFPAAMITRKAGAALAAGCTMVVKPASETPLSALALCVLAERAGVPKGVLNVITGPAPEIGSELTSNALVRKLSFTGSTAVGKKLMEQCAGTVKKLSLELGGNAPFIVFGDADIDAAVEGAMICKYRNSGQTCVCANRIIVQDGVFDEFAAKLVESVGRLKVGNGLEAEVTTGPLINLAAVGKVEAHIRDAVEKGARIEEGGERHFLGGRFFQPTVLTGVDEGMAVAHEETFGPVAPLFRFATEEEGIRLANATEFGLAAYFYSRDIGRVWRVAEALEAGMVGINTGLVSTEVAPFGGIKESGIGREGSRHGIEEYLQMKYMCLGGITQQA
ncbi:MAG: NAD-dependent succinate-semialdehyde dehydrogenase [Pseudomonadota bacterium]